MSDRVYISKRLRRFIVERAGGRCEYCLLHQDDTPLTHHIDHIVAVKHGGVTEVNNLGLSCLECNLSKGSDLTTFDPLTGEIVRLFHPREQLWHDHFGLEGAYIIGLTPCGRASVILLQFNVPERLMQRQLLQLVGQYPTG